MGQEQLFLTVAMQGGIKHETLTSGLPQPHAPLGRDEVLEIPIVFDKTIVNIAQKQCQRVPEDKEDF